MISSFPKIYYEKYFAIPRSTSLAESKITIKADVFKFGSEIFLNFVGKTQRGENPKNMPFPFKGSSFSANF